MWHADQLLEQLYEEALMKHQQRAAQQSRQERAQWLRASLPGLLGSFEPNPSHVPVLLERTECGGYIRERIELSATPGLSFPAYVLIPDGAAIETPAVLAVHGHGYGSREIVGLKADGTIDNAQRTGHKHFALELVKRGLIVIAPDVVGFGERKLLSDVDRDPGIKNSCYRLATTLLMLGKTLTGLRTAEARAALDYLISRPEVDAKRVGIMGFSGGSVISLAVAALDPRVKAAVLAGFPNTYKDSILHVTHCIDNYVPDMLTHAELPEWISLLAPRPLFLESGTEDHIFPAEGFLKAVSQIKQAYAEQGTAERLQTDLFPGGHEVCGRFSYDWLAKTLGAV